MDATQLTVSISTTGSSERRPKTVAGVAPWKQAAYVFGLEAQSAWQCP